MFRRGGRRVLITALAAGLMGGGLCAVLLALYPIKYIGLITLYSCENGLPPELVCAVINAESRFRPGVTSKARAAGLMQLMPGTAEWGAGELGLEGFDVYDPEVNIRLGCWYLGRLMAQYGDEVAALAAYNAGSGNVARWNVAGIDDVGYPETRAYVRRVLRDERVYRVLLRVTGLGVG